MISALPRFLLPDSVQAFVAWISALDPDLLPGGSPSRLAIPGLSLQLTLTRGCSHRLQTKAFECFDMTSSPMTFHRALSTSSMPVAFSSTSPSVRRYSTGSFPGSHPREH